LLIYNIFLSFSKFILYAVFGASLRGSIREQNNAAGNAAYIVSPRCIKVSSFLHHFCIIRPEKLPVCPFICFPEAKII
jgi:hypothetical protein